METSFFSFDFNFWFVAVLIILIVLVFAVVALFREQASLEKEIKKNSEYRRANSNKTVTPHNADSNITDILSRLKKLELTTTTKAPAEAIQPARTPVAEVEKPYEFTLSVPEKPKFEGFYMSTPNPDGSFEINQQTDSFKPTVSLYKFNIDKSSPAKATFEFNSDSAGIIDSLNSPKTFVEPVCYQENDAFFGAKQIITTQPGTAEKRNDKWVVVTKAKIKYQ